MKPLEILSALPKWANAAPESLLESPAWAMPCRLGDASATLRAAEVRPGESLDLAVLLDGERHLLSIADSPRFADLHALWATRAEVPEPILLALVEKECGVLLQLVENAVRRQLKVEGLASDGPDERTIFMQVEDVVFGLTRSPVVEAALGQLRFVDTAPAAPEADVQARAIAAAAVFRDEALSPADRYLRFKAAEGTRMQPDGAYYNGGIAKNRFEGYGVLLAANGRDRYEGFFRRGAKQGHGIWYYANGDSLECNFAGDAPDGPGTFTYAGGETVQGTWRQGRLVEGEGVVPTDGGARFRCLWTEGKLVSSAPLD